MLTAGGPLPPGTSHGGADLTFTLTPVMFAVTLTGVFVAVVAATFGAMIWPKAVVRPKMVVHAIERAKTTILMRLRG